MVATSRIGRFSSFLGFSSLGWGVVLSSLLLTSCLDLAVSVDFRTATAGQVRVDALAWRGAQGLQFVEGADRIDFPSTRAEWQTLVDQVSALSQTSTSLPTPGTAQPTNAALVSWTGTDEDAGFRSSTVVSFSNSRALEGLFVVFKQKLTLLQDTQGRYTLTFVPQVPRITGANPDTRRLWTSLWGTTAWTFAFTPPGQPRSERSVLLADLAGPQPPDPWTLTW